MTIRTNRAAGGLVNAINNAGVGVSNPRNAAFTKLEYEIDMNGAELGAISYTNPQGGVAVDVANGVFVSGDQYVVMTLPALSALVGLQAIVQTSLVLGAGAAISIGDSSSPTLFVNAASTLTAGTVLTQAITTNPLKFYPTANQLLLQVTGASLASASGILRIVATLSDYSRAIPSTTQF